MKVEFKRGKLVITIPVQLVNEEPGVLGKIEDVSQQQETTGENPVDTTPGTEGNTGEQQ